MKKILVVLLGLVGCLLGGCYDEKNVKGDAVISDTGFLTCPRYHIEFPAVSLDREGRAVFKVSGLPREELTLLLYVDGQDVSQREVLLGLDTEVSVRLVASGGEIACQGSGLLSEASTGGGWCLMSSANETAYWHVGCRDFQVETSREYTLELSIGRPAQGTPPFRLIPTLEGGGNELP